MNCILIGGFLGSGKTTFINYLLKNADKVFPGIKTALLINEFGEMPVDTSLMDAGNYSMREITGGCICCSLKGMLADAIVELKEKEDPDLLVIEATGLAVPSEVAVSVGPAGGCSVFTMLAVDADQYAKLAGKLVIYDRQLADADMVLLTKNDIRGSKLLADVESELTAGNDARKCFKRNEAAASAVYTCFDGLQGAAAVSSNVDSELKSFDKQHIHEKHHLKEDICQSTRRYSEVVDITELRDSLSRTAGEAGVDLYRIKGIVNTSEGWKAVQFADGELSIKDVQPPEEGESFIVYIGKCEVVEGLEL